MSKLKRKSAPGTSKKKGRSPLAFYEPTSSHGVVVEDAEQLWIHLQGQTFTLPKNRSAIDRSSATKEAPNDDGCLRSPMPANVLLINCKADDQVKRGDSLCVLEAMKMEYHLYAPFDGRVTTIWRQAGDKVILGEPILEVTA